MGSSPAEIFNFHDTFANTDAENYSIRRIS